MPNLCRRNGNLPPADAVGQLRGGVPCMGQQGAHFCKIQGGGGLGHGAVLVEHLVDGILLFLRVHGVHHLGVGQHDALEAQAAGNQLLCRGLDVLLGADHGILHREVERPRGQCAVHALHGGLQVKQKLQLQPVPHPHGIEGLLAALVIHHPQVHPRVALKAVDAVDHAPQRHPPPVVKGEDHRGQPALRAEGHLRPHSGEAAVLQMPGEQPCRPAHGAYIAFAQLAAHGILTQGPALPGEGQGGQHLIHHALHLVLRHLGP